MRELLRRGAVVSQLSSASTEVWVRWFRFPREVIMMAMRWYRATRCLAGDVEELLAERRIAVGHVTIYRWLRALIPAASHVTVQKPPSRPLRRRDTDRRHRLPAAFTELACAI